MGDRLGTPGAVVNFCTSVSSPEISSLDKAVGYAAYGLWIGDRLGTPGAVVSFISCVIYKSSIRTNQIFHPSRPTVRFLHPEFRVIAGAVPSASGQGVIAWRELGSRKSFRFRREKGSHHATGR